ncbi:MAG: penicillin-binding transpeptidase domain-containing protein, partial [Patescibacteria group bacterium]
MFNVKKELNVEEAILDSFAKGYHGYLEMPLSRQTFLLVGVVASIVGSVAILWAGFLNIAEGARYQNRADANFNEEVIIPAYRGIITDRFGEPLVKNVSTFSVFLNVSELLKNDSEKAETVVQTLANLFFLEPDLLRQKISKINLENQSILSVAKGIGPEDVVALNSLGLSGVIVKEDYQREYIDGPVFAHILGYDGQVQAGLESVYDHILAGRDGVSIVFENAKGEKLDTKVVSIPSDGYQLITTIDAGLQKYFYNRLSSGLWALGRDTGVGIAMNPKNGEVLALINLPSFNNNLFTTTKFREEKVRILNSSAKPLFNRAVSGLYNPGSTIKPLVAIAALREKIVTPEFTIFSKGFIEVPNPYDPDKPSRFVDWKPHGWVDIHSALARSSNVYFYALGGGFPKSEAELTDGGAGIQGLGIAKLNSYWQKFLLNTKTGIDLPAENSGFLPDAEEKEIRTGQIWRVGDTYNVSIGQGDLLITPIQLVNFISSLADGGIMYRPKIVQK